MASTTRALRPSLGSLLPPSRRPTLSSSSSLSSTLLLRSPSTVPSQPFSTTPVPSKRHTYIGARKTRDASKHRGESTVRRTGTRWRLSVSDDPLPRPVSRSEIPQVVTDPDHGLWDFFYSRDKVIIPPTELAEFGRAWTVQELRAKSWDDLHKLWWVCVKERNRIATAGYEREKGELGFGASEEAARDAEVKLTMKRIRHVLTERYYTWEDARELAEMDPEINLAGGGKNGPVFVPSEFMIEEEEATPEIKADDVEGESQGERITGQAGQGEVKLNVDPSTLPNAPAAGAAGEAKEPPRA